jgi:hypothetical protein
MLGNSTLENYRGHMEPALHPLASLRVHMDMYSSSVTSIEGYKRSFRSVPTPQTATESGGCGIHGALAAVFGAPPDLVPETNMR